MSWKILIIEDNEQNLYMMKFLFQKNGFDIISATRGIEGIEKALQYKPDGILLDIQLPEMNGYEVAKKIKQYEILADIPIIAVTSYAMVGDREMILKAGADGYIEKPIDTDSFVHDIKSYLQQKQVVKP
ncbi:MAG: response regulator [Deltaproteobacteria bacterium]|nr:response regulator [Deltaproteobacteria bacterium]